LVERKERDGTTEGRDDGGTEIRRDGKTEGRRDGGTEGRREHYEIHILTKLKIEVLEMIVDNLSLSYE